MGRGFDDMNSVFTMWRQPPPSGKGIAVIAESGRANISGSCVLKASMVECRLLPLTNTLDQHLNKYSIYILINFS